MLPVFLLFSKESMGSEPLRSPSVDIKSKCQWHAKMIREISRSRRVIVAVVGQGIGVAVAALVVSKGDMQKTW